MSYIAKVFNVMIASPSDVAAERNVIREVINEWNVVQAIQRKIVLLPLSWETHSTPEMGSPPQKIINRQVLDKGDLLVGVFWTRIGTYTDEYASGTVEEIEKHLDAEKPTMLYFSNIPVRLDSSDPDQYEKLKLFKEQCRSKGLFETYDTLSDFKEKFYRQLQMKINQDVYFGVSENYAGDQPILDPALNITQDLSSEARLLLKEASLDQY